MFIPNLRRLSRRRFISTAAAVAGSALLPATSRAEGSDVKLLAPFYAQGGTGSQSTLNCGPATVAAAVNYSGASFPSVLDVRTKLGFNGPTSLDQWAWLLDEYDAPWFPTWSQAELEQSLRTGFVVVVAAWMAHFTKASDFEQAHSPFKRQTGRYDGFAYGHGILIVGMEDEGKTYLVHDPNVFPTEATTFYGDGAPKGAYRRYKAAEVWKTIDSYADGLSLSVAPMSAQAPTGASSRRIWNDRGDLLSGPGGGHAPERGGLGVTGEVVPFSQRGVISEAASDDGE